MHPRTRPAQTASAHHRHVRVAGMHGLGDNLHQRAVIRQLMQKREVWLETSWPCVYHDLVGPQLHLVHKVSPVKVYRDNAEREIARFTTVQVPADAWPTKITYLPQDVRSTGSVLGAMCKQTHTDVTQADFRLPVAPAWVASAQAWINQWNPTKPILLYRPLVERRWWGGCERRNPDHATYAALLREIRDRYFVVSVASLDPKDEWIVGERIEADVELHAGELDFETLAALTARAALVYTSPGFAVILAQAVGTPSVVVFGGYENSASFSAGARFTPYLGIDTLTPCDCFSQHHGCDKRIDIPQAANRLHKFVAAHAPVSNIAPANLPESEAALPC